MFFSEFRFPYGMGERRKELGSKPGRRFTARKFREKRLIKRLASPVSHRSIIDDRHPHFLRAGECDDAGDQDAYFNCSLLSAALIFATFGPAPAPS